jgi:hypothetical protein
MRTLPFGRASWVVSVLAAACSSSGSSPNGQSSLDGGDRDASVTPDGGKKPSVDSSAGDGRSSHDGGSGGDSSLVSDSQPPTDSSLVSDSPPPSDSSSSIDGGKVCPLPTTFNWTSTGPLAQPKTGWVSLKNFSDVVFNNQHIVYFSVGTTSEMWAGGMMSAFTDWDQMATATQYAVDMGVDSAAPTLIYFTPKNIWVLMYQYDQWTFTYMTSTDPTNPNGWSDPSELYQQPSGGIDGITNSEIDNTVVCNSTTCYLFFTNDSGHVYRASMPIGDFPGTFTNPTVILSDATNNLFEAEQVYTVKGSNQYLMIVEAVGSVGRYFRYFTATDLGGSWTGPPADESTPFAGAANVTFSGGTAWTSSISSGDLVRNNPDETQTIDPCNLQFLYQGDAPTSGLAYIQLPYRPGLLTLVQ